jgi:hypothetical protein
VAKSNIVNINTTGTGPDYIDQLDIYPNPAREYVKVLVPDRESYSSARLSVSTLAGKQIISFYLDDDVVTIPTTDLNNGIYLIRLETDRNTLIRKLIILK